MLALHPNLEQVMADIALLGVKDVDSRALIEHGYLPNNGDIKHLLKEYDHFHVLYIWQSDGIPEAFGLPKQVYYSLRMIASKERDQLANNNLSP